MGLALSVEELLVYTEGERRKWRDWFAAHPAAVLHAVVQRVGELPTVWSLLDHIFLVERRHYERLIGAQELTVSTGVQELDIEALFHFAEATRAELRAFIERLTPEEATRPRTFRVRGGAFELTPRKLIFHIFFHEVWHWGQIATAVRNAGFPSPGRHDLFYSAALR